MQQFKKNRKLTVEDNYASVTVYKLITLNKNSFNVKIITKNYICIPAKSKMLLKGNFLDMENGKLGIFLHNLMKILL